MADPNMYTTFNLTDLDPEYVEDSYPYVGSPLFDPNPDGYPSHSQSQPSQTSQATTSTTSTAKRPRKRYSKVWDHFEEERVVPAGGGVVEIKAKCKWTGCTSVLSMSSKGGTGHLMRHIESHTKKDEKAQAFSASIQSRLQLNPDGSVRNWTYDPALQRDGFVI